MKDYKKIGTKFTRQYGKTLEQLSEELKVSKPTLSLWDRQGFDIFHKTKIWKTRNVNQRNKRLNRLWNNLKSRCGNPNDKKYKYYGGKGIKIKLTKEDLFILWERDKADKMKQPSIDRKDSSKDYEFSNCQFIEMADNRKNIKITIEKPFTSREKKCP